MLKLKDCFEDCMEFPEFIQIRGGNSCTRVVFVSCRDTSIIAY